MTNECEPFCQSKATPKLFIVLFGIVLGCILFVGCGQQKTTSSTQPIGSIVTNENTQPAKVESDFTKFGRILVTIKKIDATLEQHCLLLADTEPLRQLGLQNITDENLSGYRGMLFTFPADTDIGFWMKNTKIPLMITYFSAQGTPISSTPMLPCENNLQGTTSSKRCPTYPPEGPYRYAIETTKQNETLFSNSEVTQIELGESCTT